MSVQKETLLESHQLSDTQGILAAVPVTFLDQPVSGDLLNLRSAKGANSGLFPLNGSIAAGVSYNKFIVSPDGLHAYICGTSTNRVYQFSRNVSTGIFTALSPTYIATGIRPVSITISPSGVHVYIVNNTDKTLLLYYRDLITGALTNSGFTSPTGTDPYGIVISADGLHVYLANFGDKTLSQYSRDNSTGILSVLSPASITTGIYSPFDICISPSGNNVYANTVGLTVCQYSRSVSSGLLTALTPATVAVGAGSYVINISSSGSNVYVITSNSLIYQYARSESTGLLSPLSPTTIATGAGCYNGALTPSGTNLFVVCNSLNVIYQYARSESTGLLSPLSTATIATGSSPRGLCVLSTNAYVCNTGNSTISSFSVDLNLRQYGTTTGDIQYAIGVDKETTMTNLAAAIIGDTTNGVCDAYLHTDLTDIAATVVTINNRASGLGKMHIFGTWATQTNCKIVDYAEGAYDSNSLVPLPTTLGVDSEAGLERTVANLVSDEIHMVRS